MLALAQHAATPVAAPPATPQQPRLLDRMRMALRVKHYSLATERTYIGWVKRYIYFHGKRHPADMGAADVEAFLSALATELNVAASTQNQALHAILFLYREVLAVTLPWLDGVTRAKASKRLPVVLSLAETQALLRHVGNDTNGLIIRLLYGTGLRIKEALRLRIKDLDFSRGELLVRGGKGDKDRVTMLPAALVPALREHLALRRRWHDKDLATGHADVELPHALERKYPHVGREWAWQYVFAAPTYSTDPRRQCARRTLPAHTDLHAVTGGHRNDRRHAWGAARGEYGEFGYSLLTHLTKTIETANRADTSFCPTFAVILRFW